jgi:hypothetical protein
MSRYNFETSAALWRQVYSGSPKKSVLTDQSQSYDGFFQPIDADQSTIALGIIGQAYQFVTEGGVDIQADDVLVINSVKYGVRGVRRNTMKRHDFLTCVLELSVKE